MSEQETLHSGPQFDALDHGLYARFIDSDGDINGGQWNRACAAGDYVGTCRTCGNYLVPRRPEPVGTRTDYEASCVACGWTMNAPGGNVLRRSSRIRERGTHK